MDSTVSGQGPVAGCCECGDEPSSSCATELVTKTSVGFISWPSYKNLFYQSCPVIWLSYKDWLYITCPTE
jgi:hypothetical protein